MFEDAIRYPWTGEQRVETQAIGGVLTLLSVVFVPILFVYGYFVRVIRVVHAGDDEVPPVFDDWGELLGNGVVAFAVSLVYLLVPAVLFTVAAVAWIVPVTVSSGGGSTGGAVVGAVLGLLLVAVSFVATLIALYILPAAVAAYAVTEEFGAAFSPSKLRRVGGSRRYAVAWLVAFAISLLAQVVGGVASATVIGGILVPFLSFYAGVAGAYAIGRGVRETTLDAADNEDTVAGQPAV